MSNVKKTKRCKFYLSFLEHKCFLWAENVFTLSPFISLYPFAILFQHASEGIKEKMILGNNCHMDNKRVVSRERGEQVGLIDINPLSPDSDQHQFSPNNIQ